MHQGFLPKQIHGSIGDAACGRVAEYLVATCWPGGGADRTVQAAQAWVIGWRPERFAIDLTACRCATGRCRICN